MIQPEPSQEIDQFTPPMRELADGMAQYIQSFVEEVVACEGNPATIDWQYLAEDFIESCVVDIMRIDRAPWSDEHSPIAYRLTGDNFCRVCGYGWPCPTAGSAQ